MKSDLPGSPSRPVRTHGLLILAAIILLISSFNIGTTLATFHSTDRQEMIISVGDWDDPTPPHGQSGTSISATATAAGYQDTAAGLVWMNGQVCVTNGGEVDTRDLKVIGQVQYKTKDGFQPLGDSFVIQVLGQLQPGETGCYDYETYFTPRETNQYRLAATVSITNHSGWLPGGNQCPGPDVCPFGPTVRTEFTIPVDPSTQIETAVPTPTPTSTFLPTRTPSKTYYPTVTRIPSNTPTQLLPMLTNTPLPPTFTNTPLPPTNTSVPSISPTKTYFPTVTRTPTCTYTPVPPTNTPEPTSTPSP